LRKHVIILDIVGLEYKHLQSGDLIPNIDKIASNGESVRMEPVFPALTCTVQASILSGRYPNEHGIIANGLYERNKYEISFWEQASSLVQTERVWDIIKKRRSFYKTAVLFGQHTMYSNADIVITPRPLHMEDGMIMWCYSKPVGYYEDLKSKFGEFNLAHYWGPLASAESSNWIVRAATQIFENERPNLMFTYIPHIDYSAQKFGKNSNQVEEDLKKADEYVGNIVRKVIDLGVKDDTQFIIFSEYAFNDVGGSVPLNLKLRDADLVKVRTIQDREYIDLEFSNAFAMVDHQIAHIYVRKGFEDKTKRVLENIDGIQSVLTSEDKKRLKINHNDRSGEMIAISDKDKWFNYYWWYDAKKSPSFARTVDIHRKPGYDPLELFIDPNTKSISLDTNLIRGSHGRPADKQSEEGLGLYVSSHKSGLMENNYNETVSCVEIGKYIINLTTG
jgi:predicted AlkP superfamily pyrophosphatase or phosphodiesterase